jgi:hypothetical protein
MAKKETQQGYAVEAWELRNLIDPDFLEDFEKILELEDPEAVFDFLELHLPENTPSIEECIIIHDEDQSDDLEAGTVYAIFSEEELFVKTPSEKYKNLLKTAKISDIPLSNWVL